MLKAKKTPDPLDVFEFDETMPDIFAVNEDGDPLTSGQPILTVMSDTATRSVLGFSLGRRLPEHGH